MSVTRSPRLVLVFGASGSGKTTLLKELARSDARVSVHTKGTDRKPKKYDSDEIACISEVTSSDYDYIYHQYGHKYGIQRSQIEGALQAGQDHFLICNDVDTIERLRTDYGALVRAVFLLFNAPREQIEAVQRARGITDDEVELRLAKISVLSELFLDNWKLFDGIIMNRVGAPFGEMVKQIRTILDPPSRDDHSPTFLGGLSEIVEIAEVIRANLRRQFSGTLPVIQRDYVFILMAMVPKDPALIDVCKAIKRAAANSGMRAERVDDIAFTEQITEKVLGSIKCAEFVVADITHDRPNVYYEIGYAHAHNKPTILTAREGTSPHFDVQGFPIIFYRSATQLEDELAAFFAKYRGDEE